jgi:hypothetical protein
MFHRRPIKYSEPDRCGDAVHVGLGGIGERGPAQWVVVVTGENPPRVFGRVDDPALRVGTRRPAAPMTSRAAKSEWTFADRGRRQLSFALIARLLRFETEQRPRTGHDSLRVRSSSKLLRSSCVPAPIRSRARFRGASNPRGCQVKARDRHTELLEKGFLLRDRVAPPRRLQLVTVSLTARDCRPGSVWWR